MRAPAKKKTRRRVKSCVKFVVASLNDSSAFVRLVIKILLLFVLIYLEYDRDGKQARENGEHDYDKYKRDLFFKYFCEVEFIYTYICLYIRASNFFKAKMMNFCVFNFLIS